MRAHITKNVKICPLCQKTSADKINMDCLLPKEAETKPFCVDLIGRYKPSEREDVKTEHADCHNK